MNQAMNKDLAIDILRRVKEFLQINEEFSSIELLSLLKDHRKRIHPDKFTDKEASKEAEEKFKQLNELVEELDRYIEIEKLSRGAKELALYEPLYDNVALQKEIEKANEKIETLESDNEKLEKENKELQQTLEEKKINELSKEEKELRNLYKPSSQKLASLGIVFLLSLALTIMTKIEDVSAMIKKYSPIDDQTINKGIFFIFIILLVAIIKQYTEHLMFRRKVAMVCSPKFSKSFLKYLSLIKEWDEEKPKDFSEADVFSFISGAETKWKRLLSFLGFNLFNDETCDRLKDYFINSLINKKLIRIHHAKDLDRTFTIRDDKKYYYWKY